jgi:hypothetical protein
MRLKGTVVMLLCSVCKQQGATQRGGAYHRLLCRDASQNAEAAIAALLTKLTGSYTTTTNTIIIIIIIISSSSSSSSTTIITAVTAALTHYTYLYARRATGLSENTRVT